MKWAEKEMICHKRAVPSLCRPDKASGPVGVKFYCPRCKRYVREDRHHIARLREDLVPTLEELQQRLTFAWLDSLNVLAKYCREHGVRYRMVKP